MNLTLEERERRAYITGNTELAVALGDAIDCEMLSDEVNSLKGDVDELRDELSDAMAELAAARGILALA